jgi:hypothetical protein
MERDPRFWATDDPTGSIGGFRALPTPTPTPPVTLADAARAVLDHMTGRQIVPPYRTFCLNIRCGEFDGQHTRACPYGALAATLEDA